MSSRLFLYGVYGYPWNQGESRLWRSTEIFLRYSLVAHISRPVQSGSPHIQASPEYAALVDSGPSVLDPTA